MNILPFNITIKSLYYISASFSIFYFILSIMEIIHVFYNKFRSDHDWNYSKKVDKKDGAHYSTWLIVLMIINFIILILITFIIPLIHIFIS